MLQYIKQNAYLELPNFADCMPEGSSVSYLPMPCFKESSVTAYSNHDIQIDYGYNVHKD